MFQMIKDRIASEQEIDLATCEEIRRMFTDDMTSLHLLALMLTADQGKAEQCFVSGLEDCVQGNTAFRNWARAWAVRTIIKNAVEIIAPASAHASHMQQTANPIANSDSGISAVIGAITGLEPLERFAFVISVLEGYPVSECATLLNCSADDVVEARSRALESVATTGDSYITAITFAKACSSHLPLSLAHAR
jgi:hypothetical protein